MSSNTPNTWSNDLDVIFLVDGTNCLLGVNSELSYQRAVKLSADDFNGIDTLKANTSNWILKW